MGTCGIALRAVCVAFLAESHRYQAFFFFLGIIIGINLHTKICTHYLCWLRVESNTGYIDET